MAISELFTFFHHHMAHISAMRMVRRGDVAKSMCMAILDFEDTRSSQNFLDDFNGKPYSMLEPEILCKVVVVAAVEMQTPTSKTEIEVPPGHTELPTCPVCLERLDRHISGVITTVRPPAPACHLPTFSRILGIMVPLGPSSRSLQAGSEMHPFANTHIAAGLQSQVPQRMSAAVG